MWIGIIALLAMILYDVKYNVRTAQNYTNELEQQLISERKRVHMLELEWARLSRPERVAALADKYLDLHASIPPQIMQPQQAMWETAKATVELQSLKDTTGAGQ